MVDEGIEFTLPVLVLDHVAYIERNLSFIKSVVKWHAREGVKECEGLKLFKLRTVRVPKEEEGRAIIRVVKHVYLHHFSRQLNLIGWQEAPPIPRC